MFKSDKQIKKYQYASKGENAMSLTFRQNEILQYLKAHKYATISQLAHFLYVSEATVRRDLNELKKLGLLERNHGGAVILEATDEIAIAIRQETNTQDKRATISIAQNKLPPFKSVFIDNSSTALLLAQQLDLRNKLVVTNGIILATELSKRENVSIIMTGGEILYSTNSLTGPYAVRTLCTLRFNLMLCSCSALDEGGTYENSLAQAEIKRIAMKNSAERILLVDKMKFNKNATYHTSELTNFSAIFTNADDDLLRPYRQINGVNIINK